MTNATTGPVKGKPYAALILSGAFDVERMNFAEPIDALICALRYLRKGRQVRLTDRTVKALESLPELAILDRLMAGLSPAEMPVSLIPVGPDRPAPGSPFKAVPGA